MNIIDLEQGSVTPDLQLASLTRKYYLTINNTDTEIPKPDGWTGLDKSFQRDLSRHGFLFEGSENAVIKLHELEGKGIVEEQYDLYGQDALVYIKETVSYGGDTVTQWSGRLDFNKFRYIENSIELGVERSTVQNAIQSRWDTKVALSDTDSIDGTNIALLRPVPKNISLHSKSLTLYYVNKKPNYEEIDTEEVRDTANTIFISFNTTNPQKSEIDLVTEMGASLSAYSPLTEQRYNIKATYGGSYLFNFEVDFYFRSQCFGALQPRKFKNWKVEFILNISGLEIIMGSYVAPLNTLYDVIDRNFKFTYNQSHYVQNNDKIYWYCKFTTEYNGTVKSVIGNWSNVNTSFEITANTVTGDNIGYGFGIKDTLSFVTKSISDNQAIVRSNYYDNCGANKVLTSGKALRYIEGTSLVDKPTMTTSLSELVKSLYAIDGIGMGYEYDGEQEVVRIEKIDYFYNDIEILSLDEELLLDTYNEEVATDLVYSEILVGYNKYPKEDTYGLDEFNTEHTYQTPIKLHKNTLDIRSNLISSGYIIERQRRNVLTQDTLSSTDYDDDNFLICVRGGSNTTLNDISVGFREPYQYTTEEVDIGGGQIISVPVPIDPLDSFLTTYGNQMPSGSTIVISGTTSNNGTFTVLSTEFLLHLNTWLVRVNETIIEEYPVVCDIELTDVGLLAEKDDNFTVSNVLDSSTSYNLRINPKYNLLNHSKWINSSLRRKQGNEKILCKKVVQNEEFIIQRNLTDTCIDFDTDRNTYKSKEDIVLNDFNDRETIFSPERITVQAVLQPEQVKYIINCYRGIISSKKYGYITIKNPKGEDVECWLEKLTELENGMETKVEFVFIKKKT
jgi:hypothetical protein